MSNKNGKKRSPLRNFALVGAIATSILPAITGPVWAAYLSNWRFSPQQRELEFTLPPGVTPTYSFRSEPTPRLIVNIPNTQVGTDVTESYPGLVRKVSLKEFAPEQARITIEFGPEVVLSPELVQLQQVGGNNTNSWLLRPLIAEGQTTTESVAVPPRQLSQDMEVRGTRSSLFELPTSEEPVFPDLPVASSPGKPPVEILVSGVEETVTSRPSTFDRNFPPFPEPQFPSREPISLPPQTVSQEIDFGRPFPDPALQRSPLPQPFPDPALQRSPQSGNQGSVPFGQPFPQSGNQGAVPFGQPFPQSGNQRSVPFGQPFPESNLERSLLVLEEGDTLELVYPRGENVVLPRGIELQEVLLLQNPIVDRTGWILVPAKTPVIGGFESSRSGSRFIARAIYLYGRSVPIAGRSDIIEGRRRVDPRILAGASAAGGLGLLLLTGSGLGLLGGAAAGAGAVYATSPKAVTLEPAEVVEIRLTDDLPQSVFLGNR
ncbi:MAG: AMIN domain-containing protein [Cyanobacteriota bacterium]|nr:AMIN domain-containing protein [Cyanobacteriota bacterium]